MLTRSKTRGKKSLISDKSDTMSSAVSSATIQARVLAAEAEHLRRIADLDRAAAEAERAERERVVAAERAERERVVAAERAERERVAAAERAIAEAEHRALVASLEAQSNGSHRSSRRSSKIVQDWLDRGDYGNDSHSHFELPVQTPTVTSHTSVPSSVPCPAPVGATVVSPLNVTSSASGQEHIIETNAQLPQCYNLQDQLHSLPINTRPISRYCTETATSCHYRHYLPTTNTSANYPTPFSAPIYTLASRGGAPFTAAPVPRPGAVCMEVPSCSWTPGGPAQVDTLIHTPSCSLGTQQNANYCYENINKNISSNKTDTLQLAEAVANIAVAAASRTPKVSVSLPTFDGKPTDWLVFRRAYQATSPSYSPEENLSRIGAAVRGPARDAVAVLLAAGCDPLEVVRSLEVEFARPERIILAQLAIVRALPRISNQETAREINVFACRVRHCIEVVRMLDAPEHLSNPELSNEIIGKFPCTLRSRWTRFAHDKERDQLRRTRLELLSEFLMYEADIKSKYDFISEPVRHDIRDVNVKPVRCHVTTSNFMPKTSSSSPSKKICSFCNKFDHAITDCAAFKSITVDERWNWVTSKKVCHKCFIKGNHFYRKCKKFTCEHANCSSKGTHHSLLHRDATQATVTHVDLDVDEAGARQSVSGDNIVTPESVIVAHNTTPGPSRRPLLKMVPVNVSGPKGTIHTFALLDDGSTATLVDSSIADAVGATGKQSLLRVNAVGGMTKESEVSFVSLEVQGRHSSQTFKLENVRSIPNLSLSSQVVKTDDLFRYDYLSDLVEELSYNEAKPMLLIGIDNWHLTVPHELRRGNRSQPVAALTALGWVLFGSIKSRSSPVEFVNHCHTSDTDSLDLRLREYFRIDSIGISKKEYFSGNDKRAIDILDQTTRRLPDGRFETGLVWRADINNVPSSRELALSRFTSLERKMRKDKSYADAYRDNIRSTISKGYAEACTEPPSGSSITWYLPHFGVLHPQKHKLRVVHDAAAMSSGVSLNSLLLPGPDLLQPLLSILMRFREGAVALNGDIREMFPQTKIRPEDRDAQRFLWRDDPTQPVQEYRMTSMIFGATSSPFTAIYLKNRNAEEHRSLSPAAADAIVKDHYMDDFLGSVDTVAEAAQLASDIVRIHSKAHLEMRSWVSNRAEALSLLPSVLCASSSAPVNVRILGVVWDVDADTLSFARSTLGDLPAKLTKRSTLAYLMKIYDPLGFLTPIIVKGRAIFQETWKLGIGWDEQLPPSVMFKWNAWFVELTKIRLGSIPRHYLSGCQAESAELHIFSDSSELAYACVAYWRFSFSDGSVMLSLIGGKARLAPIKLVSIPRLELQAALMAARFASYIVEAHKRKPSKLFLWSDSLTVLKWLRSDARSFRPFVAHRVGEIAEITSVSDWRYVPTALNVADDATRTEKKLEISSRWFSGPSFLKLPESEWPKEPTKEVPSIPEEMKRPPAVFVASTNTRDLPVPVVPDTTRFSKWLRLLGTTARVIVCAKVFKAALLNPTSKFQNLSPGCREPTAEDIARAEEHLLLHSQLVRLREDYIRVDSGEPPTSNSRLKNLSLHLDKSSKLLRLSGRIGAIEGVPTLSQNPVVLDGKDRIVKLLIAHHHERAAHSNNELVVNELRQRFHIIGLRPAVRSVASSCLRCRIRKSTPQKPPVGDLPPERLAHHNRPFSYVGLDYFGPVSITVGRHTEKRYVALFTCLTVRAVHLEIVGSLSTDAAIMALRRFIARRGTPTTIYSDNGTAFVGASRELARLYEQPVQEFATNLRIVWKFIPPSAPFMGGCWERLVRSIKTALSATLNQQAPSEEVLQTFLLEAESLVNSRPLTHVSVDPNEEGAITPFHFILGSSSPYSVVSQLDDADLIRRVRWKRGLRLADQFWSRWVREYLPTLIPRRLSAPSRIVLKEGDLVLIADGNLPRGVWPRGRVTRTFPGKDGVIRVAEVATMTGTLRRPVRKLVLLP